VGASETSDGDVVDRGARGRWDRHILATPWLERGDDLEEVVRSACALHLSSGAEQFVVVTEKVVSIAADLAVDVSEIEVGGLARFLAARIRPRGDSLALAVPEKMQWVIDTVGPVRVVVAALASAITRPFGVSGAFYAIAGRNARSVDGVRGVYPETLLPPLDRETARTWTDRFVAVLDTPTSIIDYNDRGGSIRSAVGVDRSLVAALVSDNPLGSRDTSTPVAVVTRLPDPA